MRVPNDNPYSNTCSALVLTNQVLKNLRQNKAHCCGHKETFSIVSSFWRNISSWRELPGKTLLWNLCAAIIAETVFATGSRTWTFWSSMNTPIEYELFYIQFFLLFSSFLQHSFFRQKRVCCLWNTVTGLLRHYKECQVMLVLTSGLRGL